ncbi:hypothetical protein LC607_36235 [Nostoc sp. CHAB 5824]|nr:hypothetical protein [Nostoc sp. CHAB 5824]
MTWFIFVLVISTGFRDMQTLVFKALNCVAQTVSYNGPTTNYVAKTAGYVSSTANCVALNASYVGPTTSYVA